MVRPHYGIIDRTGKAPSTTIGAVILEGTSWPSSLGVEKTIATAPLSELGNEQRAPGTGQGRHNEQKKETLPFSVAPWQEGSTGCFVFLGPVAPAPSPAFVLFSRLPFGAPLCSCLGRLGSVRYFCSNRESGDALILHAFSVFSNSRNSRFPISSFAPCAVRLFVVPHLLEGPPHPCPCSFAHDRRHLTSI